MSYKGYGVDQSPENRAKTTMEEQKVQEMRK